MTTNHAVSVDVTDVRLPEEVLEGASVPNLLVSGPPMTDKYALMLELLVRASDRSLIISTKHTAGQVAAAYRTVGDADGAEGARVGVVDAVDRRSQATGSGDADDLVRYVGTPGNLTRIGIEFSTLSERVGADGDRIGVGLHSISPLIMHAGLQPVYRFLGALTARVRRGDHRGVVVLDTPVAEHDVESLRHHFDAVIETRRTDTGRPELRLTGHRGGPTEWTSY